MNLALPAAALILVLLPGIVVRHAFQSGRFPREISGQGSISEVAQYVLYALPLNALAYFFLRDRLDLPNFEESLGVLAGHFGTDAWPSLEAALARHAWGPIVVAYLLLVATAFVVGALIRRVVWASRWDVSVQHLRMRSDWYYLLHGRLPGLPREIVPYVDAVVAHEQATRLYQGVVVGFEVNREGQLREIILQGAMRFSRAANPGLGKTWKPIPGSRFVILADTIQNLNLRYVSLTAEDAPTRRHAAWRAWWRSFMTEEP